MTDLPKRISHYIDQHQMCVKGDLWLLAISGGLDSIVLLDVIVSLRHQLGLRLAVAHFDHRLRIESSADVKLVRELAQQYQLPFILGKRTGVVKKISEDQARHYRMKFLIKTATHLKAAAIVTGHHQDDLAETVLMRIVRGSGLSGLKAIAPLSSWGKIKVVRPLLVLNRQELNLYATERRLKHHEDITNRSPEFLRNRIRHELLPLLVNGYNPQVVHALVTLSELSSADYDYLLQEARKIFNHIVDRKKTLITIAAKDLSKLHPAMAKMVVRLSLEFLFGDVQVFEAKHIQLILDSPSSQDKIKLNLPRQLKVVHDKGFLKLSI